MLHFLGKSCPKRGPNSAPKVSPVCSPLQEFKEDITKPIGILFDLLQFKNIYQKYILFRLVLTQTDLHFDTPE